MAAHDDAVDAYLGAFPEDVREVLERVRATIHEALPGAEERISYQIPTVTLGGKSIVYFAGWAQHVSVYPVPEGDEQLVADLAPYRSGKGTAKFPLDKPVPYDLIGRIAKGLAERQGLR